MTSTERASALLALFLALATPLTARAAPPSATDLAAARELYKSGMDALDAGHPSDAVEKLKAAWQLAPTPVIGTAMARAQDRMGHLVEAREAALAVHRLDVVPDETSRSAQARVDADHLADDLAHRIPHLHVVATGDDGMSVMIDGVAVPLASLAMDRPMNPGKHTLELRVAGRVRASETVEITEGTRKEVTLEASAEPESPAPVVSPAAAPTMPPLPGVTSPAPRASRATPLVWIGAVTLGVGGAVGAVFGALALNEAGVLHANCTSARLCPNPYVGDIDAATTYSTVSTVSFVAAGVGAVLLVTGLIVSHTGTKEPRVKLGLQTASVQF